MVIDLDDISFVLLKSEVFAFVTGESRLVFSETLSMECHKMVSGTDFPFAFSLACLQGLGAQHSAKNPLCVWQSDVSS